MQILPFFTEFLQCIKRLYNCQEAGISRQACKDVELCLPQPRFDDSLEDELINYPPSSEKPIQDDSIEEILGSYLPPKDTFSSEDSKPSDSGLGIGGLLPPPPPNGHGKPVGTFTKDEMAKPSTTTKRPTQRPVGGPTKRPARPTSRPNRPPRPNRPSRPNRPNRPSRPNRPNKRPSSVQHPTQRKTKYYKIV